MPTGFPTYSSGDILTEDDINAICNAIKSIEVGSHTYAVATGSADHFEFDLSPSIDSYVEGLGVVFKANNATTGSGAVTINVNSKGDKNLVLNNGDNLPANACIIDGIYIAIYNGTDFVLINPEPVIPYIPSFQENETPSGTIDGTNDTFTLSYTPFSANSLQLFLNGVYQNKDVDYTLTGDEIVFTSPPSMSSVLRAFYRL